MRFVPVLALVALVAAGCGARSDTPFTAKGTIGCLKDKGFKGVTMNPGRVGFIAGFAANGGIAGTSPSGNRLTIAFAEDGNSVASTEQSFRLHASSALRPHITDVMSSNRNAVMVWTTSATSDDSSTVNACLRP